MVAEDNGYEEFVPSKKDFLFKEKLNVNLNNLSPDKSDTGHDYDNVSVGMYDNKYFLVNNFLIYKYLSSPGRILRGIYI